MDSNLIFKTLDKYVHVTFKLVQLYTCISNYFEDRDVITFLRFLASIKFSAAKTVDYYNVFKI